jgi:formate-dependent phosphoribosylglycinamide formyltransferase (GAR transformylase)
VPRLLLVAATTGYQTRSFAGAAKRLGIDITLATDRCHILEDPWRDSAIPVRFEEPEMSAEAIIQASSDGATLDGIVAVADRPTLVAALAAQRLGIPFHPPDAVAACRDKHQSRKLFADAGLPVPENFRVDLGSDPHAAAARSSYPCVLKPLGLSASRGVIRADNAAEFAAAFERIRRILEQPEIRQFHEPWNEAIQVEQYVPGQEFALEGLMTRGHLQVLAIFDKPDPLEGPFFEETIYTTPSRAPHHAQNAIVAAAQRAVRALGLEHGPIHAEMRVNADGVYMLEVAARPIGGLCARALRFQSPGRERLTLEEIVILHAMGPHAIEKPPCELTLSPAASGVMMLPIPRAGVYESVSGIDEALRTNGVDDIVITAKIGQELVPLPEGASYLGFIFASGGDPALVENSLRTAHSRLRFNILASLEVLPL